MLYLVNSHTHVYLALKSDVIASLAFTLHKLKIATKTIKRLSVQLVTIFYRINQISIAFGVFRVNHARGKKQLTCAVARIILKVLRVLAAKFSRLGYVHTLSFTYE